MGGPDRAAERGDRPRPLMLHFEIENNNKEKYPIISAHEGERVSFSGHRGETRPQPASGDAENDSAVLMSPLKKRFFIVDIQVNAMRSVEDWGKQGI